MSDKEFEEILEKNIEFEYINYNSDSNINYGIIYFYKKIIYKTYNYSTIINYTPEEMKDILVSTLVFIKSFGKPSHILNNIPSYDEMKVYNDILKILRERKIENILE